MEKNRTKRKGINKENVIAWVLLVLSIAAAAGLSYAITLVVSPIKVTATEGGFTLECLFHEETTEFDEIESFSLLTDYSSKTKKGYGGQAKEFGVYYNDELGSHYRLTYTENRNNYILLKRKDGSATVFNQKTESKTRELFDALSLKLAAAEAE